MANFIRDDLDFSSYMGLTDSAHQVRPSGVFVDDVIDYFHSGNGPVGDALPWEKTRDLIRFRPAEVTLWSGLNGQGKSLMLGQACIGFAKEGKRTAIASFEMRPQITLARMCRQASAAAKPSAEFIREFHRVTDGRLWLYDQQGTVKIAKVLAVIRYCADRLKIDHFMIDSLMKCGVPEDGPAALTAQKNFVDELTVAARDTGVHIHLVAHSKKGKDEFDAPGKMDVRGSGSITDQVDNVLITWRNKRKEIELARGEYARQREPDAMLLCEKQRNGDAEPRINLWFDPKSTQYLESGTAQAAPLFEIGE